MRSERLDYRELPGQNPLFLQYLYSYTDVQSFYPRPYDRDSLMQRATRIAQTGDRYPRGLLCDVLTKLNQGFQSGQAAFANIEKLRASETVAVVTGQQVGLFGGPALAVYKALSTLSLVRILESEGHSAIPVFWLAADDSDHREVASTWFYGSDDTLLELTSPPSAGAENRMVGRIPVERAGDLIERLEREVAGGDFKNFVVQLLGRCYRSGATFSQGFGCWLAEIFRDYGLVIFDPTVPEIKSVLRSSYTVAVERQAEVVRALTERSQALKEKEFSTQVQVDDSESLLFWLEDDSRYKLEVTNGHYQTASRHISRLTSLELLGEIQQNPARVSHNVLLRPILQDVLFPVVVYVGGPSEVAYFSQVNAVAPFWEIEPAIIPRAAVTLVDRKSQRLLDKYGIQATRLLSASEAEVSRRVLEKLPAGSIVNDFDTLLESVGQQVDRLSENLEALDPGVRQMLRRAEKKIVYQFEKVRNRFIVNQRGRDAVLDRHLSHLYLHLLPDGKLQERIINFNQFLIEEGPDLVGRLLDQIDPFARSHHLLNM